MRILTAEKSGSIERGFDSALKDFLNEQHKIEIRRHRKLHDRFIIFNERCWLIGGSLKDAGKKTFNMIECVDIKDAIIKEVERKWGEGEGYANPSF